MDEHDFRRKCEAALEALHRRLLALGDERGFEVEAQGEKIELLFEEPEEARFVISPHTAARQIWISALSTSFKLALGRKYCFLCAGEKRRDAGPADGSHPHAAIGSAGGSLSI